MLKKKVIKIGQASLISGSSSYTLLKDLDKVFDKYHSVYFVDTQKCLLKLLIISSARTVVVISILFILFYPVISPFLPIFQSSIHREFSK